MNRALRGVASRRGTLLVLAALTAVVTAGTVAALHLARASGASWGLAVPLLVIGVTAVPATGHELALLRRREVAVARLRGLHGARLVAYQLGEPLLVIVVGAVVGLLLGVLTAQVAVHRWLGSLTHVPLLGRDDLLGALAVVVLALVAVAVGSSRVRREPLSDQVSAQARPHRATTGALFGAVLVIVAAAVATYRARQGDDPDWVVYAGPALVGLAFGQVAVWVVQLFARVLSARTATADLPAFLASRRLARAAEVATPLRMVVAAGTVALLALSGLASVASWSEATARLRAGAPVVYDLTPAAPQKVLRVVDRVDPDGRWLMPAVVVLPSNPGERRAFVDAARYRRVVGDFAPGAAGRLVDVVDRLPADLGKGYAGRGRTLTFSARIRTDTPTFFEFDLGYLDSDGAAQVAQAFPRSRHGRVAFTVRLSGCDRGCYPTDLRVTGGKNDPRRRQVPFGTASPLDVTSFLLGDLDLTRTPWEVADAVKGDPGINGDIQQGAGGRMRIQTPQVSGGFGNSLDAEAALAPLPVAVTDHLVGDDGKRVTEVLSPGSNAHPADPKATLSVLPLVERAGQLGDLRTSLQGSAPTIPSAQVLVLARTDTPADVRRALTSAGGRERTLDDVRRSVETETGAVRTRVLGLVATCCLLVALLTLLAGIGRQRSAFARDSAALRVVGVPGAALRAAARREVVLLTVIPVLAVVGAGLLAIALLLPFLPLIRVPATSPVLDLGAAPAVVVGLALVLAVVLAVAGGAARRLDAWRTRPSTIVRTGAE